MNSLYDLVGGHIRMQPWPKGVDYDVYENEHTLTMVFYQDNLLTLDGADKEQIKSILLNNILPLNENGIPIQTALEPTRNKNV